MWTFLWAKSIIAHRIIRLNVLLSDTDIAQFWYMWSTGSRVGSTVWQLQEGWSCNASPLHTLGEAVRHWGSSTVLLDCPAWGVRLHDSQERAGLCDHLIKFIIYAPFLVCVALERWRWYVRKLSFIIVYPVRLAVIIWEFWVLRSTPQKDAVLSVFDCHDCLSK